MAQFFDGARRFLGRTFWLLAALLRPLVANLIVVGLVVLVYSVRAMVAVFSLLTAAAAGIAFVVGVVWFITEGGARAMEQVDLWFPWITERWVPALSLKMPTTEILTTSLGLGVTAFGGAALIGMLKDVSAVIPAVWTYLRDGDFGKYLSAPTTVLVSMAALCLGIVGINHVKVNAPDLPAIVGTTPAPPSAASTIIVNMADPEVPVSIPGPAGQRLSFLLTFNGEATMAAVRDRKGPGLKLHPGYDKWLRSWLSDLASCASNADKPLELTIAGFASSSDWAQVGEEVSDQRNLDLANLRADLVHARIVDLLETPRLRRVKDRIRVTPHHWSEFSQMRDRRAFADRITPTRYSISRGRLNRRAEIWIDSIDCGPVPTPPMQVASGLVALP